MPKPIDVVVKKADKVKIRAFLQANGHKKADIDKKKWDTDKDLIKSLLELHKVAAQEYRMSGGKVG